MVHCRLPCFALNTRKGIIYLFPVYPTYHKTMYTCPHCDTQVLSRLGKIDNRHIMTKKAWMAWEDSLEQDLQ